MSKRDQILAAEDIPVEKISVPEWGINGDPMTVLVKGMTGSERAAFMKDFSNEDGTVNYVAMYPSLLIKCVVDPDDGSRIFDDSDRDMIMQKAGAVLDRLSKVAFRLSGMGAEAIDDAQAKFPE